MDSEIQNMGDRKLVFRVMKDCVGVNGIDPVRQILTIAPPHPSIDPFR